MLTTLIMERLGNIFLLVLNNIVHESGWKLSSKCFLVGRIHAVKDYNILKTSWCTVQSKIGELLALGLSLGRPIVAQSLCPCGCQEAASG